MDNKIMQKLSYGLYLLTVKVDGKQNGCIINTAVQVTSNPNRIAIAVNKQNYTCELIQKAGAFNINAISESAPFSLFERFGFCCGREKDKFEGFAYGRSKNTLPILTEHSCGYISAVVDKELDLGSHMLFIADVFDGEVVSNENPMTYAYYHANTKPKPAAKAEKPGWRCKICGHVYEGEDLPADYVCPLCKHGAADFERIGAPAKEESKVETWQCNICGYLHEGALPADYVCPLCKHGADDFTKIN